MGCLLVIAAMAVPRVVMVFILLLTDWFARGFETVIWPLLGFFFMPYTTLVYMGAMLNRGGLAGGWLPLFIVAILVDAGHVGGGGRVARRRK